MYEVKLTRPTGACYGRQLDTYEAVVAWLADEPEAEVSACQDGVPMDMAARDRLREDVAFCRGELHVRGLSAAQAFLTGWESVAVENGATTSQGAPHAQSR